MAKFHEWLEDNKERLRSAFENGAVLMIQRPVSNLTANAMSLVFDERARQDQKWGEQNHSDGTWSQILLEELGEFSRDSMTAHMVGPEPFDELDAPDTELVETVAVALAWLESRMRQRERRDG